MSLEEKSSHRRLYAFILFSVLEEGIIGIIAFILLSIFLPTFLNLGMLIVIIGLVIFTGFKIYYYRSSASIPVEDLMIGQEGIALIDFQETESGYWVGKVRVRGEHWKAQAKMPILRNDLVKVSAIEGLTFLVIKLQSE
ncbi:MAG: NfeD family protein [Candidatus Thorarchaeota archaeon]